MVKENDMVRMKLLSEEFNGTELCCECGMEFDFNIVPQKGIDIVCPHCGTVQHPCSLCNHGVDCSKDCKVNVINSLIEYNKENANETSKRALVRIWRHPDES